MFGKVLENTTRWKRAKRKAAKDVVELLENEPDGFDSLTPSSTSDSDFCENVQNFKTLVNFNQIDSPVDNIQKTFTSSPCSFQTDSSLSKADSVVDPNDLSASNQTGSSLVYLNTFHESISAHTGGAQNESFSSDSDDTDQMDDLFDDADATNDSPESSLKAALIVWTLTHKIGRNDLTDLLHILRDHNHPNLPLSSKTLMKTPRSTVNFFTTLGAGLFWYYGILQCLFPRLSTQYFEKLKNRNFEIDMFVDGVSPYKSVKIVLWPICGCLASS
ncbi:hypothetical protein KUF71_011799 [Frankliniella fusca]|uniref:Uncharacterized protein n=1 Tax=Frankliniella fusca TaxID=407009 RepID=A0AAE1HJ64_9NEOP|nr:hypothetical protein KUF71_011799 [Frankliniella fusca]